MAHTDNFYAWKAGASLSNERDLREELGIAIGSMPRLRECARQAGRQSPFRRTYVGQIAWLRERRDYLRAALRAVRAGVPIESFLWQEQA